MKLWTTIDLLPAWRTTGLLEPHEAARQQDTLILFVYDEGKLEIKEMDSESCEST